MKATAEASPRGGETDETTEDDDDGDVLGDLRGAGAGAAAEAADAAAIETAVAHLNSALAAMASPRSPYAAPLSPEEKRLQRTTRRVATHVVSAMGAIAARSPPRRGGGNKDRYLPSVPALNALSLSAGALAPRRKAPRLKRGGGGSPRRGRAATPPQACTPVEDDGSGYEWLAGYDDDESPAEELPETLASSAGAR